MIINTITVYIVACLLASTKRNNVTVDIVDIEQNKMLNICCLVLIALKVALKR